jgi:hypothetical protein
MLADELVELADKPCLFDGRPDGPMVQQLRVQIDARKWLLSKLLSRKYGDRITQELVGDSDRPLLSRIELVAVVPEARLPKPPLTDDKTTCVGEATVTPLRVLPSR